MAFTKVSSSLAIFFPLSSPLQKELFSGIPTFSSFDKRACKAKSIRKRRSGEAASSKRGKMRGCLLILSPMRVNLYAPMTWKREKKKEYYVKKEEKRLERNKKRVRERERDREQEVKKR